MTESDSTDNSADNLKLVIRIHVVHYSAFMLYIVYIYSWLVMPIYTNQVCSYGR